MRVVFDTNIFVSALAIPGGRAETALNKVVDGEDVLVLSKPIIDELLAVLARKFSHDTEQLAHVAVYLVELGEIVNPVEKITVLEDDPDNRILECALAGNANIIVTGDRAMLELNEYQGVRIITLSDYLKSP